MQSPSALRRVVTIARILMGIGALVIGVKYVLDTSFLYGGLYLQMNEIGQPYPFFGRILTQFEMRQDLLAYILCACVILFGVSYVSGALVSLASVGAAFLILDFAMATSAGNILWLLLWVFIALVPLAMGFVGAGLHWGVDGWLVERVDERWLLLPLRWNLPEW